jgi:hypothetical protein
MGLLGRFSAFGVIVGVFLFPRTTHVMSFAFREFYVVANFFPAGLEVG